MRTKIYTEIPDEQTKKTKRSELDAGAEFNFFYPPSAGIGRS
jgi:hypothetical protein